MTTIKIDQKDRDAVAKVCALQMVPIECYFMENSKGDMLRCVIYSDSPAIMFYLGRSVQIQVEINDFKTA
jgi:hypothetical protein